MAKGENNMNKFEKLVDELECVRDDWGYTSEEWRNKKATDRERYIYYSKILDEVHFMIDYDTWINGLEFETDEEYNAFIEKCNFIISRAERVLENYEYAAIDEEAD